MPIYRAQCVLPYRTNVPEDVITNTLHFDVAPGFPDALDTLDTAISAFYEAVYELGMASYVRYEAAYIKYYDLSEPEPRVPIISTALGTHLGTTTTSSASQIPTEVAAVLSFQAPPEAGIAQSRRRGRIYIGGIAEGMITASAGTAPFFPMWEPAFITDVIDAAETHLAGRAGTTTGGITWVVYSQTNGAGYPVFDGWMDNAPDTQRRRSINRTSRTTWGL